MMCMLPWLQACLCIRAFSRCPVSTWKRAQSFTEGKSRYAPRVVYFQCSPVYRSHGSALTGLRMRSSLRGNPTVWRLGKHWRSGGNIGTDCTQSVPLCNLYNILTPVNINIYCSAVLLYTVQEHSPHFLTVCKLIHDVIEIRTNLMSGAIASDNLQNLKAKLTTLIDVVNELVLRERTGKKCAGGEGGLWSPSFDVVICSSN